MRRSELGVRAVAAVAAVTTVAAVAACSDGDGASAGAFCQRLSEEATQLVAPLASGADVDALVERYRDLADDAPLAVEEEWHQLVTNLETADTVDPSDPASVQRAANTAYASEEAAHAVARWAADTCGVQLGPVGTVAPPASTTTTTTAPAADE